MNSPTAAGSTARFDPSSITRPDSALLHYYLIVSFLSGPLLPFVLLPLLFKYHTLQYRFDESGISMSYGVLFRREIHLTYRRIQDIHLTRNVLQRWMGLATVAIQTASGNAGAEMSIEGILAAEPLRDYLYGKMRGARGEDEPVPGQPPGADGQTVASDPSAEALLLLREIRDSLRRLAAKEASS